MSKGSLHQARYYKDNDKDIVLKIILSIKEQHSAHHNYNDKAQKTISHFFQLMNDTNIDSQSESILLYNELENLKRQTHALRINRRYCSWCGR